MTAAERLRELAEILAAGVQRFLARGIKPTSQRGIREEQLDAVGAVEAPCGATTELPA